MQDHPALEDQVGQGHAQARKIALHAAPIPNPEIERGPLRVGFVSADFRNHPVGHFSIRALENLDRRQCEVVCYSDRFDADDLTTRIRAAEDGARRSCF